MMTMMKGGSFRFRGKEASLLLIALVCATVLLWSWERTPSLSTLLPPPAVVSEPGFTSSKDVEAMVVATRIAVLPKEEIWPAAAETNLEDPPVSVVGGNDNAESSNDLAEAEGNGGQGIGENELIEKREAEGNGGQGIGESDLKEKREAEGNDREGVGENDLKEKEASETKNRQGVGENYLKEKEQTLDLGPGVHSANANSSVIETDHKKSSSVLEESQVCEYSKGKWIVDDRRPLYSGFHCKQWLSQMWACRLTQRKDFAYERLRWEPKGCQMEDFEGSKFLKRMQDKTLAFVGDSLGRQQFQSLMCMITAGKAQTDVLDVGHKYGLIKPRGSARPNGWAYRFPSTNTTVLYYWSACLCDLEPINITNPTTEYAMHLDRPPAFLRQYLHQIDVLVLNTGHHWNRGKLRANRWVMYVGGMPNTNKKLAMIGDAKNFTIHSIVSWVNAQLPKYPDLRAFYRSISPRHFVNGDWNTGGSCNNTTPLSIGKEVTQDESSDYSAGNAVRGTGVKLLDITALSQLRDEGHISRFSIAASAGVQDCLHWCLPGVPDTWNEILFAKINDDASLVQNEY